MTRVFHNLNNNLLNYIELNLTFINIHSFTKLIEYCINTNRIIKINIMVDNNKDVGKMNQLIVKYGYDIICTFLCDRNLIGLYCGNNFMNQQMYNNIKIQHKTLSQMSG